MERIEEESDSKLSVEDEPPMSSAPSSSETIPKRHGSPTVMAAQDDDRMAPPRTMRFIPVLDDGRLSASGSSHSARFSLDDESLMGTVSAPSEGDWPRPRKPSAYYLCVQRCTILSTVCLVMLAFGAVITGVSKQKSHHAMFYIEVRHTTERSEATLAPDYTVVKVGDGRRALDDDTTVRNDTASGDAPLLHNDTRFDDVYEESE